MLREGLRCQGIERGEREREICMDVCYYISFCRVVHPDPSESLMGEPWVVDQVLGRSVVLNGLTFPP